MTPSGGGDVGPKATGRRLTPPRPTPVGRTVALWQRRVPWRTIFSVLYPGQRPQLPGVDLTSEVERLLAVMDVSLGDANLALALFEQQMHVDRFARRATANESRPRRCLPEDDRSGAVGGAGTGPVDHRGARAGARRVPRRRGRREDAGPRRHGDPPRRRDVPPGQHVRPVVPVRRRRDRRRDAGDRGGPAACPTS